jgi:hypothetical protein
MISELKEVEYNFSISGAGSKTGLGWVSMSLLPVSTPSFEIGKNSNPVNSDFPHQSRYGLGGFPPLF